MISYDFDFFIVSEPATDSTNSSEEENSIGATSSSPGTRGNGGGFVSAGSGSQSENARIRMISRQQLQAALQQIELGSVNSLSNIAARNSDANTVTAGAAPLSTSASGERISSALFRNELQRALRSLNQPATAAATDSTTAESTQAMDTTESSDSAQNTSDDGSGEIPSRYRLNQYAEQLRTMAQMGFTNYEENLTFLNITNGNIENAVNLIMGSMN